MFLPSAEFTAVRAFLTDQIHRDRLFHFIERGAPDDTFILIDGLNLINNREFLTHIVTSALCFPDEPGNSWFTDVTLNYFTTLSRSFGAYLFENEDIDICMSDRSRKIGMIRAIFFSLLPYLLPSYKMILITGSSRDSSSVIQVSNQLLFVLIQGERTSTGLECDDLLLLYLVQELHLCSKRGLILSGDYYNNFRENFSMSRTEWRRFRKSINAVLSYTSSGWSFQPGYASNFFR